MFSNPLDADNQARISALIQEILASFSTQFPVCYAVGLVNQVKSDANPEPDDFADCKLEQSPVPSEPLKSGFMTKRGDAHKNWKRRHVVAYNAADNYRIDYHDGEGGKIKGSINCAGYGVEKFNEDDELQFGQFGIKLVPWQRLRRTWFIRCDNEEDRTAWMKVFETACWKSRAPEDPNPLIAYAFRGAFERVRWNYGYWGYYYSYGTEDERLGDFIRQVLARDIVDAVIGGIPDGFFRAGMVNMVETTIGTSVRAAVSAAWKAVVAGVNTVAATLEATAKSNLGPIFEQQNKIKDQIVTTISGTTGPFFSEYGGKLFTPVLEGIASPVARAFALSIKGLHAALKEKLAADELSTEAKRTENLIRLDRAGDWWYSGPLASGKSVIWEMYGSAGAEIFSAGGYSLWNLRMEFVDRLEDLFHRAVYTLGKLAKESPTVAIVDHANEIMRRYIHDAKIFIKVALLTVLKKILDSPLNQLVITPAKSLVEPIQAVIDAIPIPGLNALFDLTDLLGGAVSDICDNAIEACCTTYLGRVNSHVDSISAELVF